MEIFKLVGDFITIAQLLKTKGYVSSGGEVASFLLDHQVLLNDQVVFEKRKKIYQNDLVQIDQEKYLIK